MLQVNEKVYFLLVLKKNKYLDLAWELKSGEEYVCDGDTNCSRGSWNNLKNGFIIRISFSLSLSLYIYIYICNVCVCVEFSILKKVWLNKTDTLCLHILALIRSSLCISCLTSGWNAFKKVPYFSQVLLVSAGFIFGETNNEITSTVKMTGYCLSFLYFIQSNIKEIFSQGIFTKSGLFVPLVGGGLGEWFGLAYQPLLVIKCH